MVKPCRDTLPDDAPGNAPQSFLNAMPRNPACSYRLAGSRARGVTVDALRTGTVRSLPDGWTMRPETRHVAIVGARAGLRYTDGTYRANGARSGLWTCYGPEDERWRKQNRRRPVAPCFR